MIEEIIIWFSTTNGLKLTSLVSKYLLSLSIYKKRLIQLNYVLCHVEIHRDNESLRPCNNFSFNIVILVLSLGFS